MSANPIVDAHDLGRRFRDRWAVRSIELTLARGEMIGIVGADGAGKTTLLQMCAAILDPTEGNCSVFGLDTVQQASTITARIGYMSQGFTLYDRLTVSENLRLSARLRDVPTHEFDVRRQTLLEMAGLTRFEGRTAGKLSGGMRKKLALCTNLVHRPPLLLLDEPGLGVDPLSRQQLWEMLDRFRGEGTSIIVSTSYMEEAERCDRVLLLQAGRSLGMQTLEAARQQASGRVFELPGTVTDQALERVARLPGAYGIQVLPGRIRFQSSEPAELTTDGAAGEAMPRPQPARPTLEDVFVLHAGHTAEPPAVDIPESPRREGHIEVNRLTVRFGDFTAVDEVTLDAGPGQLLALLGPNGAGKTTLIRALSGLAPVSSGWASIGGIRVSAGGREIREQIGYMSQHFSLYPDLTLTENLEFFASAYGLHGRQVGTSIRWAAAATGLTGQPTDVLVADLSGATRQRLALACSILHHPAVLFLDEPTSGIDPLSRYRFWRLIRELAGSGMVVVVTTHYLHEAEYCDRIGLMHQGRLVALGTLDVLRRESGLSQAATIDEVFVAEITRAGA